ncbi:MAG TPA: class I adenylate-forming enzyme family protein [Candidatus Dormibacteraeota bacterium]
MTFRTVPDLLRSAVERYADALAIVTSEGTESFRELGSAVDGTARALRDRSLEPGDRVLIVAPNSVALVHVWLGAICAGAIPAAVNPESTQPELEYFSNDLQPRLTDAGYRDQDGDVFLSGRYREVIRRRGENIAPAEVEELLRAHEAVEVAAVFGVDAGLEEEEVVASWFVTGRRWIRLRCGPSCEAGLPRSKYRAASYSEIRCQ